MDDGSADKTAEIVQSFCNKFIRFKLIAFEKNMGRSFCRDVGVKQSRGKYVAFLDAHIILKNDMLMNLERYFIQDTSLVGISGKYETENQDDSYKYRDIVRDVFRKKYKKQMDIRLDQFSTISTCISVFRRSILKDVKFPEGLIECEDLALQVRLLNCGYKFLYISKLKCIHNSKISHSDLIKKSYRFAEGYNQMIDYFIKTGEITHVPYSPFLLDISWSFLLLPVSIALLIVTPWKQEVVTIQILLTVIDFHRLYKLFIGRRYRFEDIAKTVGYIILDQFLKVLVFYRNVLKINNCLVYYVHSNCISIGLSVKYI